MAHSAPKDQRSRPNDTARRQAEFRHYDTDGELRGPELPDHVLGDGVDWHPCTLEWWDTWRRSPQAQTFSATDWNYLLDTAFLHHTMWMKGRWEYAGEVRIRVAKFGATPEDRQRLRMKVDTGQSPSSPSTDEPSEQAQGAASRRKDLRIVG